MLSSALRMAAVTNVGGWLDELRVAGAAADTGGACQGLDKLQTLGGSGGLVCLVCEIRVGLVILVCAPRLHEAPAPTSQEVVSLRVN